MLAGRYDAAAMLSVAAGLSTTFPWMAQNPSMALGAMLATAAGASWMTFKQLVEHTDPTDLKSRENFIIKSDEPFPVCMGTDGIRLGYTKDKNHPVDLSNDLASRHICITGQSGVGKTVLGEYLLEQQTVRGGGWLFVDAKLDFDTRNRLAYLAAQCGRADDFYVLNPGEPDNSNTYNPILDGSGEEVASRLLNLIPSTDNNPGADHYKQTANQALMCLVNVLKQANRRYHFEDLTVLLQSPRAMEDLARLADPSSGEARAFAVFIDQYRVPTKDGPSQIDMKKVKDAFGGIAGRMALFSQGNFGKIFNSLTPEINLYDIIREGKMLYVMLPTMASDNAALNLGKMIISDLRSAVARVQGLPEHKRPNPPFLAFLDEMGSYVMPGVARLFEQARSARICLIPAFQSFANLSVVSPDFADLIIQNTWTKALFKFGSTQAEEAAELLGQTYEFQASVATGNSVGVSAQLLRTSPTAMNSDGVSVQSGYRQAETFRVKPDHLRALGKGECFVQIGARLYHINTPMIGMPSSAKIPHFRAVHRHIRMPKDELACGYATNYKNYISSGS